MLGGMRAVTLPILMYILNKNEAAVFKYCRFSLFLKDPFFQIILSGKREFFFTELNKHPMTP